jgi:hypothetical protein
MDIQFEVQKIHSQFGTTEMANYQIQKLFDKLILEDRAELLRIHDVVGRSEQCVLHSTDWNGKCFKCGEQVFVREPK